MKSQAFAFPGVLLTCFPSYVATKYNIKYFSIDLMSLIIPSFSVFLCYAIIPERGACAQLLVFAATHFRKPPGVLVSPHFAFSAFYLCGPGEGSPRRGDAPCRQTLETTWEEEMSPAFSSNGSCILRGRAPVHSLQTAEQKMGNFAVSIHMQILTVRAVSCCFFFKISKPGIISPSLPRESKILSLSEIRVMVVLHAIFLQ